MRKLLLVLVFLLSLISQAQDVIMQGSGNNLFISKQFSDKEKKFSHTSFRKWVVDKNGIVWIATEMGLYRFEGTHITRITDKRFPAIATNRIVKLSTDYKTGDIIFVTYPEKSMYSIRDNMIQKITYLDYPLQSVFSNDNHCILPNSAFHKKIISHVHNYPSLKNNGVGDLSIVKNNDKIYAGLGSEIFIFNKKGSTKTIPFSGSSFVLVQFGDAILAMSNSGVFLLDENHDKFIPIQSDNTIQLYLKQHIIGMTFNLYLSNGNNFLKHKDGIYRLVFRGNTLSADIFISKIPNDTFFFGHYHNKVYFFKSFLNDFTVLKPIKFNTITVDDTSRNNCYAVVITDNNTWVSASGWIYNTVSKNVKKTFRESNNKSVIIPYNNSLYNVSDSSFYDIRKNEQKVSFYKPSSSMTGYTFFKDKIWMSQDNLLVREKGKHFEIDTFFSKRRKDLVVSGIHAFNNQIVVLTSSGVYNYKPFKSLTPINGLQNIYPRYFKTIDKNSYWIGCYGNGLFLVSKNRVFKVKDMNQELTAVHAIEEDSKGNLWMSTNDGLLTVNKKTAIKNILNSKPVDFYRFTTDDGLPTNEFNGGGTNPSIQDKNGIIGFPSVKGFVWFHPENIVKHLYQEKILVDKVSIDGVDVKEEKGAYFIQPKAQLITIDISFAYYFNRDNITVEYCFTDETVWHEIKDNEIKIPRVSAGKRQMLIRIHTHGFDSKYDVIRKVTFEFEPKFYETTWFIIVVVIVLLLLVIVAFKIGLLINRRQKIVLEEKVRVKTIELQNLTQELTEKNGIVLESLKEKEILIKEIHHRVKNNLQLVITLLSYQSSKFQSKELNDFLESGAGRIVSMALIHENLYQSENMGYIDFKEYVNSLVQNIITSMTNNSDVDYQIDVDEIIFDIRVAIPLGLIVNELIVNTIKHNYKQGDALNFSLHLHEIDSNNYKLTYKDPQSSMTADDSKKTSFGLELIHLLASQLKGSSELSFSNGLTVTIDFKSV